MHLKENNAFVNSKSDTVHFFMKGDRGKSRELYRGFLEQLIAYWEAGGYRIECDVDKLISVGVAAGVLFIHSELFGEEDFAEIYKTFCEAETDRFFQCTKRV